MNKPIVNCTLEFPEDLLFIGSNAFVFPVDHPNHKEGHNISNQSMVRTSRIVAIDHIAGTFETTNTIYKFR
jgi:hypothetical protein